MERPTLDKFPASVLAQIDIQTAFIVSRLIIAAERIQIFRALHSKDMTAETIGRTLGIHKLYLKPFLCSLVSLGLLRATNKGYRNTRFTEKYFIGERSIHWTRQYSRECVEAYHTLTTLEKALVSGRRYESIKGLKKHNYLESMKRDKHEAEDFTQMLFYLHQGDAGALANYLDLSTHRAVLDVGGGSGVMSIALVNKNPHLNACILDIAPVCKIAAKNVKRARLSRQIRTLVGDIRQSLPRGFDVVLFCDIGAVSMQNLRNAYHCLPAKGLLVLADRYLTDGGTKPLDRLVEHFVGSSFGLATRGDMVQAVKSCGFQGVTAKNAYRDLWFITGTKPDRHTGAA